MRQSYGIGGSVVEGKWSQSARVITVESSMNGHFGEAVIRRLSYRRRRRIGGAEDRQGPR